MLFLDANGTEGKTDFFVFLVEIDGLEYFEAAIDVYDSTLDEFRYVCAFSRFDDEFYIGFEKFGSTLDDEGEERGYFGLQQKQLGFLEQFFDGFLAALVSYNEEDVVNGFDGLSVEFIVVAA